MGDPQGICLPTQEIIEYVHEGKIIIPSFSEENIQPSSMDAVIGDTMYILDHEEHGIIGPRGNSTVYRSLLELPSRSRVKVDITNGHILKAGYTYLVPLEERLKLDGNEYARSSPKSSGGRIFFKTRLLGDYNSGFDEIHAHNSGEETMLWLLLQPLVFDAILFPGLSLNQLRIFNGYNAQVNTGELMKYVQNKPILYDLVDGEELVPAKHEFRSNGLLLHADLKGEDTEGIVGLRARKNTTEPIDLSKKKALDTLSFFDPIKAGPDIRIEPGEHYLFASKEVIVHPTELNSELVDYASVTFTGPTHFAGFIDNGFKGDLVFEIVSDERGSKPLEHGMPISHLKFFRTGETTKVYGEEIGSSYQGQKGSKPAKFFKDIDYKFAGRNHEKLKPNVLVQDASVLKALRRQETGYEPVNEEQAKKIIDVAEQGFFHTRFDCEEDELLLQPIPYVLIFQGDKIFKYIRSDKIEEIGEARLFGKHSFGVGGHVHKEDGPNLIQGGLERQLFEEIDIEEIVQGPTLRGTLFEINKELPIEEDVNRVHFGLVYTMHTEGKVHHKGNEIKNGSLVSIDDIINDPEADEKFETWSRVLLQFLPMLKGL